MHSPAASLAPVPSHVPPARVYDFDIYAPAGYERDYHLAIKALHDRGVPDLFWTPRNGGHWVAKGRDVLAEVFKDSSRFSSRCLMVPKSAFEGISTPPITSDPPEHAAYRALISPAFSPRAVAAREAEVRALTVSLIEGLKPRGGCEFVRDFAKHLPIKVFMGMVDLPDEDREPLVALAEEAITVGTRSKLEIIGDLQKYVAVKIEQRKGGSGTDLISHIARSTIEGRPITDAEAKAVCSLLLIGGLDTVASMLGFIAHFLANNPTHRRQLIERPDLMNAAIEELLRRFALTNPGRMVIIDTECDSTAMQAGEMVMLCTAGAAVDPRTFADAEAVDFTRDNPFVATFGNGVHRCPGAMLARVEIKVFLQEWLARIPDFRVDPQRPAKIRAGINGSFEQLPLVWD